MEEARKLVYSILESSAENDVHDWELLRPASRMDFPVCCMSVPAEAP